MKSTLPLRTSRMRKRNGRSIAMAAAGVAALSPEAVAATATVPSSSTSTSACCVANPTCKFLAPSISEKSAAASNASGMPMPESREVSVSRSPKEKRGKAGPLGPGLDERGEGGVQLGRRERRLEIGERPPREQEIHRQRAAPVGQLVDGERTVARRSAGDAHHGAHGRHQDRSAVGVGEGLG